MKLPALTMRIYQALSREFSKYEVLLEATPSRKVGGFVISHSFEGKNQMERQQRIWQLLEKNLNHKELNRIVGILTFTPAERQFILTE
jgi:acid stress-induced BolA-like protein IbaG/YrbA